MDGSRARLVFKCRVGWKNKHLQDAASARLALQHGCATNFSIHCRIYNGQLDFGCEGGKDAGRVLDSRILWRLRWAYMLVTTQEYQVRKSIVQLIE